jgi:hypothetical protein
VKSATESSEVTATNRRTTAGRVTDVSRPIIRRRRHRRLQLVAESSTLAGIRSAGRRLHIQLESNEAESSGVESTCSADRNGRGSSLVRPTTDRRVVVTGCRRFVRWTTSNCGHQLERRRHHWNGRATDPHDAADDVVNIRPSRGHRGRSGR